MGIDPGAHTGIAVFKDGALTELDTIEPQWIEHRIRTVLPSRVIFEDSRLQSYAWNARSKASMGVALAAARSLGQVDAWCSLITAICGTLCIHAHGISPKQKGSKQDAQSFNSITRWSGRSNQHERDAAMVAWPYRNAR
jgi:hypothetical protein